MTAEDYLGREYSTGFLSSFAAKDLASDGESSPLIVTQQDAFDLLFEHLVYGCQIFDPFLSFATTSACENCEAQLPGCRRKSMSETVTSGMIAILHHLAGRFVSQRVPNRCLGRRWALCPSVPIVFGTPFVGCW